MHTLLVSCFLESASEALSSVRLCPHEHGVVIVGASFRQALLINSKNVLCLSPGSSSAITPAGTMGLRSCLLCGRVCSGARAWTR